MKTSLNKKNHYARWSIVAAILLAAGVVVMAVTIPFVQFSKLNNEIKMNAFFTRLFTGGNFFSTEWMIDGETFNKETTLSKQDSDCVNSLEITISTATAEILKSTDGQFHIVPKDSRTSYRYEIDSAGKLRIQSDIETVVLNDNDRKFFIYIPTDRVYEYTDVNIGAGSAKIDSISANTITLHVGAGELSVQEISAQNLYTDVGAGTLSLRDAEVEDATLKVGMGELTYQGKISGHLNADVGMGTASFTLNEKRSDHRIYTNVGLGEVSIGDSTSYIGSKRYYENYKGEAFDDDEGSRENYRGSIYKINCGLGQVDMEFAD